MLDSPVDRAARRLHGVPVAVTAGLEEGRGLLLSRDSAALAIDSGIQVRWSGSAGEDFETNLMRARVEVRAAVQTLRPSGMVSLALGDVDDG